MIIERNIKEYKMNGIENMTVKYGSTNRKNPQVLYVTGKTWVRPVREGDFSEALTTIKKRMERRIKNKLRSVELFDPKYIFDFSLTPINMKVGKPKFMCFHLFMRQNKEKQRELKAMSSVIDLEIVPLIKDMVDDFNENNFQLSLRKNINEKKNKNNGI